MKEEAIKILKQIRNNLLDQCATQATIQDVWLEYTDCEWRWATESAKDEFIANFDDYNNWIWEDDFETEEEWERAKKEFVQEVINKFKK